MLYGCYGAPSDMGVETVSAEWTHPNSFIASGVRRVLTVNPNFWSISHFESEKSRSQSQLVA